MKQFGRILRRFAISPAVPTAVIGIFSLIYIGIAFNNDEALVTLIAFTRKSLALRLLFACIPLNLAARIVFEIGTLRRRITGECNHEEPVLGAGEERVHLETTVELPALAETLRENGYRCRSGKGFLLAKKGISLLPARLLFLLGTLLLFSGILFSISSRLTMRVPLIEGEPLPEALGARGQVEQVALREQRGLLLERSLAIQVLVDDENSGRKKILGLYPPASLNGTYLYPRYLGLAPLVEFKPPEPAHAISSYVTLMIYPPGKEDSLQIPDSPYTIQFSLAEPKDRQDPYITGKFLLQFRVLREKTVVAEGMVPMGETFSRNGYSIAFRGVKKLVATDLVRDPGLLPIWLGALVLFMALVTYLPIRLWAPLREMLFFERSNGTVAFCRAEGRGTAHHGLFNRLLDGPQP